MPEELLEDVKDYLKITWTNEKTDKSLLGMINRGMAYLNNIAGMPLDFSEEDSPKSLLLDYVRYANSQALEMFAINFSGELTALHYTYQASLVDLEEEI